MTSTIMREPEVYDVWLMRVEFPDHPGVGKVRPVIVTRVEEDRVSGIVVKVTSVTTWNGPGDVPLLDANDLDAGLDATGDVPPHRQSHS